jgi:hypothetical protein
VKDLAEGSSSGLFGNLKPLAAHNSDFLWQANSRNFRDTGAYSFPGPSHPGTSPTSSRYRPRMTQTSSRGHTARLNSDGSDPRPQVLGHLLCTSRTSSRPPKPSAQSIDALGRTLEPDMDTRRPHGHARLRHLKHTDRRTLRLAPPSRNAERFPSPDATNLPSLARTS